MSIVLILVLTVATVLKVKRSQTKNAKRDRLYMMNRNLNDLDTTEN